MFTVKYQKDKGFFFISLLGKLDGSQSLRYIDIISKLEIESQNITIIIDYRNAKLNETSTKPISEIAKAINSKIKAKYKKIRWAGLANDPMFVTGIMILKSFVEDEKLKMQAFSSLDSLLNWVNLTKEELNEFEVLYDSQQELS